MDFGDFTIAWEALVIFTISEINMMESNNMTKYFNTESYYKILLLQIIFTIPALIIFIQFITSKLILGIYGIFFYIL